MSAAPLMKLTDLSVTFATRDRTVHAVNGVNMELAEGEVLCILGESGSGKSVTLRALMRLLPKFARVTGGIEVAGATKLRGLGALQPAAVAAEDDAVAAIPVAQDEHAAVECAADALDVQGVVAVPHVQVHDQQAFRLQ